MGYSTGRADDGSFVVERGEGVGDCVKERLGIVWRRVVLWRRGCQCFGEGFRGFGVCVGEGSWRLWVKRGLCRRNGVVEGT